MSETAFTVQADFTKSDRWLTTAMAEQVPFATARALTRLASEIQRGTRGDLGKHFHVRRPRMAQGIQMTMARKADGLDGMFAEVGTVDPWAWQHEEGGERKPGDDPKTRQGAARKLRAWEIPPYETLADVQERWAKSITKGTTFGREGIEVIHQLVSAQTTGRHFSGGKIIRPMRKSTALARAFGGKTPKIGEKKSYLPFLMYIRDRDKWAIAAYPFGKLSVIVWSKEIAHLKAIWPFTKDGTALVDRRWDELLVASFDEAIKEGKG